MIEDPPETLRSWTIPAEFVTKNELRMSPDNNPPIPKKTATPNGL